MAEFNVRASVGCRCGIAGALKLHRQEAAEPALAKVVKPHRQECLSYQKRLSTMQLLDVLGLPDVSEKFQDAALEFGWLEAECGSVKWVWEAGYFDRVKKYVLDQRATP